MQNIFKNHFLMLKNLSRNNLFEKSAHFVSLVYKMLRGKLLRPVSQCISYHAYQFGSSEKQSQDRFRRVRDVLEECIKDKGRGNKSRQGEPSEV